MRCPFCGHKEDKVVDSRVRGDGSSIRRRRECLKCGRRFTTYEYIEDTPLVVIKKDGRRQVFDRNKILQGLLKACEKRAISMQQLEQLVTSVERTLLRKYDKEVPSEVIGKLVMEKLSKLDEVAYVRFASVYREFKDINQFMQELKEILTKRK